MIVFRCPVCGGELELDAKIHIGKCQYCGSTVVIPHNFEKIGNLFNRANFLRQTKQFDKAIGVYEEILKEDNENSAAHFGLLLSNYGIEYVQDPKTQEMVPVCHRAKERSVLQDPEYLKALDCADATIKNVYIQDAEKIDKILKKIIDISRNEDRFEVFISYRETNEAGVRTEESLIAQEIYQELSKLGYKCFFARKTLENKLGKEYEPIIFSALSSAKVMLVIGCAFDNFQSVWVKNEWSRFLELKKQDPEKLIIPCYKNISPYELPDELSIYQSENIAKIGFLQEICDGIERVFRKSRTNNILLDSKTDVDRKLKNAEIFLKLNNGIKALEIYKDLANNNPEDYRVWWELARYYSDNFTNAYNCSDSVFNKVQEYMKSAIIVAENSEKEKLREQLLHYITVYRIFHKKEENKQLISASECEELEKKLLRQAMDDLNKKNFSDAYSKFDRCISVIEDSEAYWGMLLAKNKCENDEALVGPDMIYKLQEECIFKNVLNETDENIRRKIDKFLGHEWEMVLKYAHGQEKENYVYKIEKVKKLVLERFHEKVYECKQQIVYKKEQEREERRRNFSKFGIVVISGIALLLYIYFADEVCFTGYYRLLQPMILIGLYNLIILGFTINPFLDQEKYLYSLSVLIDIIFVIESYCISNSIGAAIFIGVVALIGIAVGIFISERFWSQ